MAEPTGTPSAEGNGTPAGGAGGGDGNGSGGTPPPAASGAGATIPISALPEALRGVAPEKIGQTLNEMLTALVQSNKQVKELRSKLNSNPPGTSRPENVSREEGGDPQPTLEIPKGKTLSDWLLDEPEKAMDYYLQKKFGSSLAKLSEIDSRLGRTEFNEVRGMFDDFDEHEEEVVQLLNNSGAPKTRENIMGAYTMIVGQKTLEEKMRGRRAAAGGETPTPEPETPKKEYVKMDLGEEIRQGMGMSEEDYYENYAPGSELKIKVPR